MALPTCGLALAESERYLPSLVTRLEAELEACGLADEDITIRMTGCPNGCARPYMSEIGLVGRSPGFTICIWAVRMTAHGCPSCTPAMLTAMRSLRHCGRCSPLTQRTANNNETFGDFVIRAGIVARTIAGLDFHENLAPALRN